MNALEAHIIDAVNGALSQIRIYFDANQLRRWMSALNDVEKRVPFQVTENMQRTCSIDYAHRVMRNIMGGRYGAGSPPVPSYHPRYARWKLENFGNIGTWRLKGDLVRNITFFKVENGWMGGVPNGVYDSGGKSWYGQGDRGGTKEIARYGRANEFGLHKRPVFGPTRQEYMEDADDGWMKRGEEVLVRIGQRWR